MRSADAGAARSAAPSASRRQVATGVVLGLVIALVATIAAPATALPTIQRTLQVIGTSSAGTLFDDPSGLAVEPGTGDLFIADTQNNRIVIRSSTARAPITGVNAPTDIAFTASGDLYIVDHHTSGGASRILRATRSGGVLGAPTVVAGSTAAASTSTFNPAGSTAVSPLTYSFSNDVRSITVASNGVVYVVDHTQAVVIALTADNTSLDLLVGAKTGGVAVTTSDEVSKDVDLGTPTSVSAMSGGDLYIGTAAGKLLRVASTGTKIIQPLNAEVVDIHATPTQVYAALRTAGSTPTYVLAVFVPNLSTTVLAGSGTVLPSATPAALASTKLDPVRGLTSDATGKVFISSEQTANTTHEFVSSIEDTQEPEITSTPPTSATVGTGVSHTFTAVGLPAPTWSVTGSLPNGLSLDATTGVLSGVPTAAGTSSFTVSATNSTNTDPQPVTLVVSAAPSGGGGGGGAAPTALLPQTVALPRTLSAPLGAGTARLAAKASAGGVLSFTSSDPSVASVDGGGVLTLRSAGTTTVTATAAATATHAAATATATVVVTAPSSPSLPTGATRLAGADRVDTSVQVSRKVFADPREGAATAAVIATASSFADSVAGARLAGQAQAPLLLTDRSALDGDVAAEVRRLVRPGGTVYVLGRTGALSAGVESALQGLGSEYAVQRLGGADRYETAVAVADAVTAIAGDVGPIHLVTGRDFADGVSVAAFAQRTGGVVLLTDGPRLPPATAAYLKAHDPKGDRAVAVGGAAAAAARMAGFDGAASRAVVGADRYATSAELAKRFAGLTTAASPKGTVTTTGLAGGASWPDALAGSAAMAHLDGPLLLTPTGTGQLDPTTAAALRTLAPGADRAVVFGGPKAVSEAALGQVAGTLTR